MSGWSPTVTPHCRLVEVFRVQQLLITIVVLQLNRQMPSQAAKSLELGVPAAQFQFLPRAAANRISFSSPERVDFPSQLFVTGFHDKAYITDRPSALVVAGVFDARQLFFDSSDRRGEFAVQFAVA